MTLLRMPGLRCVWQHDRAPDATGVQANMEQFPIDTLATADLDAVVRLWSR
jgi:hypothetical protein